MPGSQITMFFVARRRVMVLDAGKIVEFDTPEKLLEKRGHFYSMTKEAGITAGDVTVL